MKKGKKLAGKGSPSAPKGDAPRTLLDRRAHGWKLRENWPGLFSLWERKGKVEVDLSDELQRNVNTLTRGHSYGDKDAPKLERALVLAAMMSMEGDKAKGSAFDILARTVADAITETLGAAVLKVLSAGERGHADDRATDALALCKRALNGIVKIKFPSRARGSGAEVPREVCAINAARLLCQIYCRLPTQEEVVMFLDPGKTAFGRTKDWRGKWRIALDNCGLSGLPGTLPPRD